MPIMQRAWLINRLMHRDLNLTHLEKEYQHLIMRKEHPCLMIILSCMEDRPGWNPRSQAELMLQRMFLEIKWVEMWEASEKTPQQPIQRITVRSEGDQFRKWTITKLFFRLGIKEILTTGLTIHHMKSKEIPLLKMWERITIP